MSEVGRVGGAGSANSAAKTARAAKYETAVKLRHAWDTYLKGASGKATYSIGRGDLIQVIYGYQSDIERGSRTGEAKKGLNKIGDLLFKLDKALTQLGYKRDNSYRIYKDNKGYPQYSSKNVGGNFVEMVYDLLGKYTEVDAGNLLLGNKTINSVIERLKQ